MIPNKRKSKRRQTIILFVVSVFILLEVFLYLDLSDSWPMLFAKSIAGALVSTFLIQFFGRRLVRFYIRTFSKDYKYNKYNRDKK